MEHQDNQCITERLILLYETTADLLLKLETALILLNGASCALQGQQAERWQKMYAELKQEMAND
jgi:hypothetical protein